MIYLYAIIDDPRVAVVGLSGLSRATVELFPLGQVTAVGSRHDSLELEASAEVLWGHERVAAALMSQCTVAPTRFGTVVPDERRVRDLLLPQEAHLASVLAWLRGKTELALRASLRYSTFAQPLGRIARQGDALAGGQPTAASPGRRYLRHLQNRQASGESTRLPAVLHHIHAALAQLAVASTATAHAGATMTASYLVATERVTMIANTLAMASQRFPTADLSLTGPWPPYSFINGPETPVTARHFEEDLVRV